MKTGKMPFDKYCSYPALLFTERSWPNKTITKAPAWCSVDLRDGNQALPTPMNVKEKLDMFNLLVAVGFKEIEVAFPSASQTEFDFVRKLIEENHIPDDVTIQVLTPARTPLIQRTFEALQGVKQAVVHLYNSTSMVQRNFVFCKNKSEITGIAVDAASLMSALREQMIGSHINFEYSPESFTGTELDYTLEICQAVKNVWRPTRRNKVIINLPATVEMSTPNVYADRIEWFSRHIEDRDSIILSVHTHNDRGTAVAAAELAVMAGAQRVEGALFGNGERTGNMDILTMALNLFSNGIDPKLDFSDMNNICDVYARCTRMNIHARHPYAGNLVYTAFSGSHQDAINKGMKALEQFGSKNWNVPYLPIDPQDVGRNYQSIIRINSQSGKGGIAYVVEKKGGFHIPKAMQPEFARIVQKEAEHSGKELSPAQILACFKETYLFQEGIYRLKSCTMQVENDGQKETSIQAVIQTPTQELLITAKGIGPVDAFVRGLQQDLGISIDVVLYEEHALSKGSDAQAVAYIGVKSENDEIVFGAGIDANISTASIKAVVCALNRRENDDCI